MTDRRTRQFTRAVREYQRQHPRTTLEQAREAVSARSGQNGARPDRLPHPPLPRPGERLPGYVKRVADALDTPRHRAMERLGLQPGASATRRLAELADGLPDDVVSALCAATGMTPAQARALTASPAAYEALRRISEEILNSKMIRPGGRGKTRTSSALAMGLALRDQRVRLIDTGAPPLRVDTDPQRSLDWPGALPLDPARHPRVVRRPSPARRPRVPRRGHA
ncbi:hypothetical protein ABZS96_20965 [Streptomyces avermitilis]|uniref:hypothetical protein n=1 Tax=Streptomyces avermitilis TaxID=33903 RepID=UPI0033A03964